MRKDVVDIVLQGKRFCSVITGGGTGFTSELLEHGGGSKVLLESLIPYSKESIVDLLKREPDHFVTPEVAESYANIAYERAVKLSGSYDVCGLGVTAKLASDGERNGREHRICISLQNENTNITQDIVLKKDTRFNQEQLCNALVFHMMTHTDRNMLWNYEPIVDYTKVASTSMYATPLEDDVAAVYHGKGDYAYIPFRHNPCPTVIHDPLIMPGSFNPIHKGHIALLSAALESHGGQYPVYLELSVANTDKPKMTYSNLVYRINEIKKYDKEPYLGGLLITNKSVFADKVDLFRPGETVNFVVGTDTINRIVDSKYYPVGMYDIVMSKLIHRAFFYVGERKGVNIHGFTEQLDHRILRNYNDDGISSTQIRKAQECH